METNLRRIRLLIEHPIIVVLTWVTANLAAAFAVCEFLHISLPSAWTGPVLYIAATALIGVGFWGTYVSYQSNRALKCCVRELHQINHFYRDTLARRFFDPKNKEHLNDTQILMVERQTLDEVCGRISTIFRELTVRNCFVAVYLIRKGENNAIYCSMYAASANEADRPHAVSYIVDREKNTRFWEASSLRPCGMHYFHSADLEEKFPPYFDEMNFFEQKYKSCIVVPIRYRPDGENAVANDLGYLVVDTLHTHRLNNRFHVHYLAAFADQMFYFMQIWRSHLDGNKQQELGF